jgi:hypothetical protein
MEGLGIQDDLDGGDLFRELLLNLLDRPVTIVQAELGGRWGVLLLYRGHW